MHILILAFLKYWDFDITNFCIAYWNHYNIVVWHCPMHSSEKELIEGDPVLRGWARADAYWNQNNTLVWHCHTHLKRKKWLCANSQSWRLLKPEQYSSMALFTWRERSDCVLIARADAYWNHNNTVVWCCHTHLKRKN